LSRSYQDNGLDFSQSLVKRKTRKRVKVSRKCQEMPIILCIRGDFIYSWKDLSKIYLAGIQSALNL
jgi:hypothetical protein